MPQVTKVATTDELADQQAKLVEVEAEDRPVSCGRWLLCPERHLHPPKGTVVGRDVEGADVTCPWHGAKFDVRTGAVLGPPAGQALKTYPVRVTGADIEIEM
jgi:3-phenylpropionate/trans-cinnamate dioxygenase ferredoxin component